MKNTPSHGPDGLLVVIQYERHEPEKTLLHEVIREQLEPFLARARGQGAPVARFVEREIRAHLVDHVIPVVPARQWVLTLPYPLRYRCAWDARLTTEVLRAFLRALFADQRRRARRILGVRRGHNRSVTFIQRFGSALNLTPHFHTLVLDGVYPGPSHDLGSFVPLPPPQSEDVGRVLAGTARRILRVLECRGFDPGEDSLVSDDPLLALLTAASIRSRIAAGPEAGESWRRLGDRVEPLDVAESGVESEGAIPPRSVREGGMSLYADVAFLSTIGSDWSVCVVM